MTAAEIGGASSAEAGMLAPTCALAAFAAGALRAPLATRRQAARCLREHVVCTLDGAGRESARRLRAGLAPLWADGPATVAGSARGAAPEQAALLNGAYGHAGELDDTHRATMSHPGDAVVAAALAVAEARGRGGAELLDALVVGYDVALRIGEAVMPSHYHRGWHPSGTVTTFGAAAACARLLGLDAAATASALGIAGAHAAGCFAHLETRAMTKDLNCGRAARDGVVSAHLAAAGFSGPPDVLESPRGFFALYARESDPARVLDGLGEAYKIDEVGFKLHAGCRHLHAVREAVVRLLREGVAGAAVAEVEARIFATGAAYVDDPVPWVGEKGCYASRFSAQFNLAALLVHGPDVLDRLGDDAFVAAAYDDARIREAVQRVRVVHDRELDRDFPSSWASVATLRLHDGRVLARRVDFPPGEPEAPASEAELEGKLMRVVGPLLGEERARRLGDALAAIDDLDELTALSALLRTEGS